MEADIVVFSFMFLVDCMLTDKECGLINPLPHNTRLKVKSLQMASRFRADAFLNVSLATFECSKKKQDLNTPAHNHYHSFTISQLGKSLFPLHVK